jgi:ABC-type multidrug transport system ATPase subunit
MRIETQDLTKRFGNIVAVDNLNLTVQTGESYGFLGPNGAGKTTTLMMLLGVIKPTAGEVSVAGQKVRSDSFGIKRRIGVVTEYQSFYDDMTAREYIEFFGRLFEVEAFEKRYVKLMEHFDLLQWQDALISSYSSGMKKKLGFVRALIHSPDLLVLDEPVSSLDPFGIIQVREILAAERNKGCTLLISSHILSEVEQTVDRVGIIAGGRLIAEDSMENIRHGATESQCIELHLSSVDETIVSAFEKQSFVRRVVCEDDHLSVYTAMDKDYRTEIGKLVLELRLSIVEMRKREASLEEALITITEKNLAFFAEQLK